MDSRSTGSAAIIVGLAMVIVAGNEYFIPLAFPEPGVSGVFLVSAGLLLSCAGLLAILHQVSDFTLQLATAIGVLALGGVVLSPDSLLFGGIFWNAMVVFALVGAGVYPTIRTGILAR